MFEYITGFYNYYGIIIEGLFRFEVVLRSSIFFILPDVIVVQKGKDRHVEYTVLRFNKLSRTGKRRL